MFSIIVSCVKLSSVILMILVNICVIGDMFDIRIFIMWDDFLVVIFIVIMFLYMIIVK